MYFYVKGGPKKDAPPPPPDIKERVVKEWEHVIAQRKEGKIVDAYGYADRKGGFIVYKVESREELEKLLNELPMAPFSEWEIIELVTLEEALERTKQGKLSGKPD